MGTQSVNKEKKIKEEDKKKKGGWKMCMICLSAHSNCFSLLHNQTDCTGSSEIAAYVTGAALEITDGISLLQNTTHLLLDRYTAKLRIFSLFSDEKQEVSHLWCLTSLWKSFASHKMKKNGCNYLLAGTDTTLLRSKGCHSSKIAKKWLKDEDEDEFSSTHNVRVNYKKNWSFALLVPPEKV